MAAKAKPQAQYQHFVPQFLLKNFAHPYKPDGGGSRRRKDGAGRKFEKGMYPNDPVVRHLDLVADQPAICEKPVKRILGQINVYQDTSKPTDQQQHIEEMLSKLEASASQIIRKITKAFEQKEAGLWLTRSERDLLRKFLFLLKYRSDGFRRRFFHQDPESYSENDRLLLREYMAKHGFKRPLDVWFHNIKCIIELEMDPERKWARELRNRMYPEDALWFLSHVEFSYMAICTPSNPEDEFILTDNCYGIFEGPNHYVQDAHTSEVGGGAYTPLHEFAPLSPKLAIVLRSHVLPNPLEDANPITKAWREFHRFLAVDIVYDYEVTSLLADLPIEKATNNYTRIEDGRIYPLRLENWRPSQDHKFCFRFFPISSDHVHTINAILLDHVAPCTCVVFESQASFARTLEWYLTAPCDIGKRIFPSDFDGRGACLKKLESVSRSLGSAKETVWMSLPDPPAVDYEAFLAARLEQKRLMNRWLDGGSVHTMMEDLTQAQRMWTLRVKIDAWSEGRVDEKIRQRNRELLLDAYLRLPPRRVWSFVKFARLFILSSDPTLDYKREDGLPEAEDIVARAPSGIPEVEELACQAQREIVRMGGFNSPGPRIGTFGHGEKIELLTRAMVRERFMDALKGRLEEPVLRELRSVLFGIAYPTPPPGWQCSS
ncbi:uncharacterized protein THITE_2144086 [Thermothielavioides terrestris NRRL 8126]|uniref:DUF4238 domain-containing protein n=1 Tax=Thermothielavioides terrestris (strain ATCC 38088 / NRRL 8126) TaxID=578455 RepID=G2R1L4_THETT|nr:uncharacterized protein THITE_2144086 [Thermothielavioides terrestris NRRL 8126]AEO66556.1 hypothetical protein THITE_2144086 [Thermothielavioides terrestris NRRL 8126]